MLELCFLSQWYQQKNKSATELGMTQSIPNNRSIYIHKEWVTGQEISRWSTDSSLQQHIQQRFAKVWPRSIRLSKVRIWSWAAVHIKNATLWNLYFPNALPRESRKSYISNLMIERLNVKLPTSIESPTKSVTTSTPRNSSLNEVKKGVGSR